MRSASAVAASSPDCRPAQYCMTMAMAADPQPAFTWWTNGTSSHGESAADAGQCTPKNKSASNAVGAAFCRDCDAARDRYRPKQSVRPSANLATQKWTCRGLTI